MLLCYQVSWAWLWQIFSRNILDVYDRVLYNVLLQTKMIFRASKNNNQCIEQFRAPVYAMHMSVSATAMLLRTAGSAAPRSWAAKWGTHALARPSSPRHSFPSAVHACA